MSGWEELRRLSDAATPGPWRASIGRVGVGALSAERQSLLLASVHADGHRDTAFAESHDDAAFIVAAVNYVRATLSGSTAPLDVELMTRAMERAMAAVDDEWTIPEFADLTVAEYARLSALEAAT